MPTNHPLPSTLLQYPQYSQNLPRLVALIEDKYPGSPMIDVGANIGDTARFVRASSGVPILSIEGNQQYLPFLRENVAGIPDVEIEECYLGDVESEGVLGEVTDGGTGRLARPGENSSARLVRTRRLDDVLTNRTRFAGSKMLKSDTDGFEARVLRGAHDFLRSARPVVFLEYDPQFLEKQGDSGLTMLRELVALGYTNTLVYDAFGTLIFGLDLGDWNVVEQIHVYVWSKTPIPYLDLALFHGDDVDLFEGCFRRERDLQDAGRG